MVRKLLLSTGFEKMITSAYFKSCNSLGFNSIWEKLYETICEKIVFKMECRLFLIVLLRTIFRNREITKSQISREQFIFKKFLHTVLKILSAQIRINIFLFKNFFSRTCSFSHNFKTTNLVSFFTQKFNFTLFLSMII